MKKRIGIIFILILTLLLCACGVQYGSYKGEEKEYYEPGPAYQDWEYPILDAEHGEDYVIEWVDKGMEAHVRLCLDKPEGDIYHSDVWDIRFIWMGSSAGYDVFLETPKDRDYFLVLGDINPQNRIFYNEVMPDICSLQDLRHFDSLQIFSISTDFQSTPLTDISGPEECKNLQVFRLFDAAPDTLEPISKMTALERLSLCSFINEEKLDLTSLQNLEHLFWLQLGTTDIVSLEPLCELDLRYLGLHCGYYTRDAHKDLDYSPISQMDSLLFLDLENNLYLSKEELKDILQEMEYLETVRVSYIFTKEELAELRENFPNVRILGDAKQ